MVHLAIALLKYREIFLQIIADCFEDTHSFLEWFDDIDYSDPDLSDQRAKAYRDLQTAAQLASVSGGPTVTNAGEDPLVDVVLDMLFPSVVLNQGNRDAVVHAVQAVAHNSNKKLDELFRIELVIAPTELKNTSEDLLMSDALKRLDLQIAKSVDQHEEAH